MEESLLNDKLNSSLLSSNELESVVSGGGGGGGGGGRETKLGDVKTAAPTPSHFSSGPIFGKRFVHM
jgi:hypothetical protein